MVRSRCCGGGALYIVALHRLFFCQTFPNSVNEMNSYCTVPSRGRSMPVNWSVAMLLNHMIIEYRDLGFHKIGPHAASPKLI
jgi:hypothetical protein